MLSTYVFLGLNGYELDAGEDDLFETTLKVATKRMDIKQLAEWLKKNSYKK